MSAKSKSKRARKSRSHSVHKPRGVIHPRVQAVGPEHFAFICVDCAKSRSKMMIADFYGRVLMEPTIIEHNRVCDSRRCSGRSRDTLARHRHQRPDRRHRADGALPWPGPARLRQSGDRGPHPSSLHHQTISPVRRSGQQNRRHRPLCDLPRRRQRFRPVGARTRSDLRSPPTPGKAPPPARAQECHAPAADARTSALLYARIFVLLQGYFRFRAAALGAQAHGLRRRDSPGRCRQAWSKNLRTANVRSHRPTLEKIVAWARSAPSAEEPVSNSIADSSLSSMPTAAPGSK